MPFTLSWSKAIPDFIKNIRDSIVYGLTALLPFSGWISSKLGITLDDYTIGSGIIGTLAVVLAKMLGVKDEVTIKASAPNDEQLKNS